jgi:hypothetical protein
MIKKVKILKINNSFRIALRFKAWMGIISKTYFVPPTDFVFPLEVQCFLE